VDKLFRLTTIPLSRPAHSTGFEIADADRSAARWRIRSSQLADRASPVRSFSGGPVQLREIVVTCCWRQKWAGASAIDPHRGQKVGACRPLGFWATQFRDGRRRRCPWRHARVLPGGRDVRVKAASWKVQLRGRCA